MSSASAALLTALKPTLFTLVEKTKDNFTSKWGDFVKSTHAAELEDIFLAAGRIQVEILCAETPEEIADLREAYVRAERRIDTLGFEILVVGKIDAKQFIADEISSAACYAPIVVATAIKVLLPVFVPGVGGLIAAPLGAGVQYFLAKIEGVPGA